MILKTILDTYSGQILPTLPRSLFLRDPLVTVSGRQNAQQSELARIIPENSSTAKPKYCLQSLSINSKQASK